MLEIQFGGPQHAHLAMCIKKTHSIACVASSIPHSKNRYLTLSNKEDVSGLLIYFLDHLTCWSNLDIVIHLVNILFNIKKNRDQSFELTIYQVHRAP